MPRTKQEIFKLHKESPREKTTAKIYEIDGTRVKPEFDVDFTEDTRGFYKKLKLKATKGDDSPWSKDSQGTDRVIIKDFDMEVEVVLPATKHRPEVRFSLGYGDLCDIVTAFQTMDYFYKKKRGRSGKTPVKIGKVKTRKLK